jgi:hypothetical protein
MADDEDIELQTLPITETWSTAFWNKVEVRGSRECWPYKSPSRTQGGYGASFYGPIRTTAHRIAYVLSNGPFPKRLNVVHRCDNRICCNPRHLFLGTALANTDDMIAKKRQKFPGGPKGERNGNAKLTDEEIAMVRFEGKATPQRELARRYGVSKSQIGNILRGESRSVPTIRSAK